MSAAIELRRLTFSDLPQVTAIERRAFPTPWSVAMFVLELSKSAGVYLCAVEGGRVVGYLICSRYVDVWHVMNVAVEPARRREGIARALIDELLAQVNDPQACLTLEVRPSNEAAIELYGRYGFLSVGRRRRYYQDNGEDALIMWRTPATLDGRLDDVPNSGPVQPTP